MLVYFYGLDSILREILVLVFEYYSVYIWGRFISDDVFSLPYIVSLLSGGRKSVIYLVVAYDLTPRGSAGGPRGVRPPTAGNFVL